MKPVRTIVWDVDDTLNDLMRVWLDEWFLPRNIQVKARYMDIKANPPHKILGINLEDYLSSYDKFRLSGSYAQMPPAGAALRWFKAEGHNYRHIALTAVPLCAAHESAGWVFRHFGRWIRTFHVVPSPRKSAPAPLYEAEKADFIKRLDRCDFFVDDSRRNLAPVARLGVKCVLVPKPWNGAKGTLSEALGKIRGMRL
ncbi:MAG TPA: hypothetical protein DCL44_00180 [Elusimicrobia bacterium]|nr:hypothetical protein [Elusimicrobiota bacterium]